MYMPSAPTPIFPGITVSYRSDEIYTGPDGKPLGVYDLAEKVEYKMRKCGLSEEWIQVYRQDKRRAGIWRAMRHWVNLVELK